jgi:cobalt-zinc-cadmium efflux system membrane fusion protein
MQKIFSIITLGIFLFACGGKKSEEPNKQSREIAAQNPNTVSLTAEQLKNAGIETGKVHLTNISSIVKVSGQIDVPPQNLVAISVPMGGYLQSTRLLPGMQVKKGEVIALIQDQQYIQMQQDYLTAKARVSFLEKEYERQKDLNQSKATSDKQFQQTESEYRVQQATASGMAEKLKLIGVNANRLTVNSITRSINVYSPITGFVSKVNVSIGKYVSPSDILFEIINPNSIHLALNVFEKDINSLKVGQKVLAYSNNNPVKKYNCRIMLINKDVSPDRSAEVHCHFENYDKDLVPGMFMNAEIEKTNYPAYVLPEEAIVSYENKNYVFIAKGNNEFEIFPVQTGTSQNGEVEIKLSSNKDLLNESFVTKGAYNLLMKLKNTGEEE